MGTIVNACDAGREAKLIFGILPEVRTGQDRAPGQSHQAPVDAEHDPSLPSAEAWKSSDARKNGEPPRRRAQPLRADWLVGIRNAAHRRTSNFGGFQLRRGLSDPGGSRSS